MSANAWLQRLRYMRAIVRFATLQKWQNLISGFVSSKAAAFCISYCAFCSCTLVCLEALNLLVGKLCSGTLRIILGPGSMNAYACEEHYA